MKYILFFPFYKGESDSQDLKWAQSHTVIGGLIIIYANQVQSLCFIVLYTQEQKYFFE